MKATGIVRRIDELGRIVVPKEIRRTMRIREGDPLEIFTEKDGIVLKKYSAISRLTAAAQDFLDAFYAVLGVSAYICDNETVVAACGAMKQLKDSAVDEQILRLLHGRRASDIPCAEGAEQHLVPIISSSDIVGGIVIGGKLTENAKKAAELGARLLAVQIE